MPAEIMKVKRNGVILQFKQTTDGIRKGKRKGQPTWRLVKPYRATTLLRFAGREQAAHAVVRAINGLIDYSTQRDYNVADNLTNFSIRPVGTSIPELQRMLADSINRGAIQEARRILQLIQERKSRYAKSTKKG